MAKLIDDLSDAAKTGDIAAFNTLIRQSGNTFRPDMTNTQGETLLLAMAGEGHKTFTEVSQRTLLGMASGGREELVAALKRAQSYVISLRAERATKPPHPFAHPGQAQIARWLLQNGARTDAKDAQGHTALQKSVYADNIGMAQLLLEGGASVGALDNLRQTALHQAAIEGFSDITALLLANGAMVDAVDAKGFSPLHYASFNGYFDVARVLVESGADPRTTIPDGQSAIHLAANFEHIDVALYLVSSVSGSDMTPGADVFLDDDGAWELGLVIELFKINRDTAITALQSLMERCPKSPQLWISLFVFLKGEQNDLRQTCCENAIALDPGFYDGYRRLGRLMRSRTCRYYSVKAGDQERFFKALNGLNERADNQKAAFVAANSNELLMPDWNNHYEGASAMLVDAFENRMDQHRYSDVEIDSFDDEVRAILEMPHELRPWYIIQELFQAAG